MVVGAEHQRPSAVGATVPFMCLPSPFHLVTHRSRCCCFARELLPAIPSVPFRVYVTSCSYTGRVPQKHARVKPRRDPHLQAAQQTRRHAINDIHKQLHSAAFGIVGVAAVISESLICSCYAPTPDMVWINPVRQGRGNS